MVKERIRRRELVITQIIPHRAKAVKRERRRGTPRSRFAVREDGERRGATGSYGGRPFRPPTRTNPNPVKGNCVWEGRWALYIRAKRIAIVFGTALVEGENSSTKNTRLRKGVLYCTWERKTTTERNNVVEVGCLRKEIHYTTPCGCMEVAGAEGCSCVLVAVPLGVYVC